MLSEKRKKLIILCAGRPPLIFVIFLFCGGLYLDLNEPEEKPLHKHLFTFLSPESPQIHNFMRLDRLSNNYFYVGAHGAGNPTDGIIAIEDGRDGSIKYLSARAAAKRIRSEMIIRNIDPNMPIFLLACNAGAGKNPFAKELSEELGTLVVSVSEWLVVDQLGKSRSGSNIFKAFFSFGRFNIRTFSNGEEII